MAHEANFCGDRLRMSAFLRVMEHGIPPRPRRFRHRVQAVEEPTLEPDLIDTYKKLFPIGSSSEKSTHNIPHPLTPETPTYAAEINYVCYSSPSNGPAVDADPAHRISCSLTPAEPCRSHVEDVHDASTRPLQQHSSLLIVSQSRQNSNTKGHKTRNKPCGSWSIRNRCLPMNSLALIRTLTPDGIPVPSKSKDSLTTPISKIDPIEDSQMGSGKTVVPIKISAVDIDSNHLKTLKCRVPPKSRASSTHANKLMKSPVRKHKKLLTHHNSKLEVQSSFATASDGFVGEELTSNTTKKKRTQRPRKNLVQLKQLISPVVMLALSNGRLPSPRPDFTSPSSGPSNHESFSHMHTPLETENNQYTATSEHLTLVTKHNVANSISLGDNHFQLQENVIRTQLSSITAPPRRNSESSQSAATQDDGFVNDKHGPDSGISVEVEDQIANNFTDDKESNEADRSSHFQFLSLRRKPTYVDGTSYFQNAMNDLDLSMMDIMESVRSRFPEAII